MDRHLISEYSMKALGSSKFFYLCLITFVNEQQVLWFILILYRYMLSISGFLLFKFSKLIVFPDSEARIIVVIRELTETLGQSWLCILAFFYYIIKINLFYAYFFLVNIYIFIFYHFRGSLCKRFPTINLSLLLYDATLLTCIVDMPRLLLLNICCDFLPLMCFSSILSILLF